MFRGEEIVFARHEKPVASIIPAGERNLTTVQRAVTELRAVQDDLRLALLTRFARLLSAVHRIPASVSKPIEKRVALALRQAAHEHAPSPSPRGIAPGGVAHDQRSWLLQAAGSPGRIAQGER